MRHLFLTTCLLSLLACSTFSFAPPAVDVHHKMTSSITAACVLNATETAIDPDVDGALDLVGNYLSSYHCAMRQAANGRQPWEILSFLSLVGSTTAVALGAGTDVAILGGAGNSVFTAGNKYYAAQEQTTILSNAVDALACIQSEAVGTEPFTLKASTANFRFELRVYHLRNLFERTRLKFSPTSSPTFSWHPLSL